MPCYFVRDHRYFRFLPEFDNSTFYLCLVWDNIILSYDSSIENMKNCHANTFESIIMTGNISVHVQQC